MARGGKPVAGNPYAQEVEQRILRPLELDETELPTTRLLPNLDEEVSKGSSAEVDWANPNYLQARRSTAGSAHEEPGRRDANAGRRAAVTE